VCRVNDNLLGGTMVSFRRSEPHCSTEPDSKTVAILDTILRHILSYLEEEVVMSARKMGGERRSMFLVEETRV
jgi:hypothetical protein